MTIAETPDTEVSPVVLPAKPKRVPRGYETIDSIVLTEPRIAAIQRELQALLEVVQLESDGKPIDVDGFRLRNNADWADYPTSLSDIFWHLSSVCNFSCEFCYEKGNPAGFPIQNAPRMANELEIETRLHHYDTRLRRGMFTVRTAINEPFVNPRAIDILERMRAHNPDELLSFVTNGSYFTEDLVARLAELRPIFFNLSIYSTDEEVRRSVLRDRRPQNAVRAVELLRDYRVPYMSNVVMWPSIPLEDLDKTVAHMERCGATLLRVCLGGYSRYLPGAFDRFSADTYWRTVVDYVDDLRNRCDIPILIEPNTFVRPDTDALIEGVVIGSPAQHAGLRRGDELVEVNGEPVVSRMQALAALRRSRSGAGSSRYRPPGVQTVEHYGRGADNDLEIVVRRRQQRLAFKLDRYRPESMATYPYNEIAGFNDFVGGMVLSESLRYNSLIAARDIIRRRTAQHTLLLTSTLMEAQVQQMIARTAVFAGMTVVLKVADNNYFGGSINIGDLLVVEDFIEAIEDYGRTDDRVDLVLIPSSAFASSPWGRDLTGQPWQEIERRTGVAVELIPCANITY